MEEPKCGKCGGEMERGFMVDNTYAGVARPQWAEGEIDYSVWMGVKMGKRERFTVNTYRCSKCGYLESYAMPEAAH